jgi:CHAT domain-containing protein
MKKSAVLSFAILGAALVVLLWHLASVAGLNGQGSGISRLARAAGAERHIVPRLVGGFQYGPLKTAQRGTPASENLTLLSVAAELQQSATRSLSDSDTQHAWAVAQLLLGDPEGAARTLELSINEIERSAEELANLAAIYAARASSNGGALDWLRSLAWSERALRKNSRLQEALFNRALAIDALGLRKEAIDAWRKYLAIERGPGWSTEARLRLEALVEVPELEEEPSSEFESALIAGAGDHERLKALILQDPQATRALLERKWLADFAATDTITPACGPVAELFSAVTGDAIGSAFCRSVSQAPKESRQTVKVFLDLSGAADRNSFDLARRGSPAMLAGLDVTSPFAMWIDYYRLQAAADAGVDPARTLAALDRLEAAANRASYLHLAGTAANRSGQLLGRLGRQQSAIEARDRAIAFLQRARSDDLVATMYALVAESVRLAGNPEGAFVPHLASLNLSGRLRTRRARHQVYVQAGLSAMAVNFPEAAAVFFSEARRNGQAWPEFPAAEAIATLRLSSALRLTGAMGEARAALAEASRLMSEIPDPGFRERTELELLETRAAVLPANEALAELDRAIQRFSDTASAVRLPRLQWMKAQRLVEIQRYDDALAAVDGGVLQLRRDRQSLTDESLRRSQAETFIRLQREAANILVLQERHELALVRLDSIKALSTEEVSAPQPRDSSFDVTTLRPLLAATSAILFLADINGRTDGWLLTPGAIHHRPHLVETTHLGRLVARLREALRVGAPEHEELSSAVGRRLIAPFRSELSGVKHLVIVPSPESAGLPFAALRLDAEAGYLIESVDVSVEPSLELFRRHAAASESDVRRIVVAVAGEGRGTLMPLPMSAAEGRRVADLYPSPITVTSRDGLARLEMAVRSASVFHFIGHAVVDGPEAVLVFGEDETHDLTFARIRALGPTPLRVVVLAACSTAFSQSAAQTVDALLSAASPFLSIGVPEVVGTLWPVEDDDAARLSYEIHQQLAARHSAVAAVATVQRRAISARTPIAEWSALQVIGSPSTPS